MKKCLYIFLLFGSFGVCAEPEVLAHDPVDQTLSETIDEQPVQAPEKTLAPHSSYDTVRVNFSGSLLRLRAEKAKKEQLQPEFTAQRIGLQRNHLGVEWLFAVEYLQFSDSAELAPGKSAAHIDGLGMLFEVGKQFALNEKYSAGLFAGWHTMTADREQDDDIYQSNQEINFQSGQYLRPMVGFQLEPRTTLEAGIVWYLQGDVRGEMLVNIGVKI